MFLVTVTKILQPRQSGIETWITSDGRAYLVQLYEASEAKTSIDTAKAARMVKRHQISLRYNVYMKSPSQEHSRHSTDSNHSQTGPLWQGTCIHNVEPPKWVQKRRMVRPDDPDADQYHYDEPRCAVAVAINTKFSVVAVGMHGYAYTH